MKDQKCGTQNERMIPHRDVTLTGATYGTKEAFTLAVGGGQSTSSVSTVRALSSSRHRARSASMSSSSPFAALRSFLSSFF